MRLANASLFHFMPKRQRRNNPQPNESDHLGIPGRVLDVCLLSLKKCRSLLSSGCNMVTEVEALRDSLYCLAAVALGSVISQKRPSIIT
jgi:hypothetical protein